MAKLIETGKHQAVTVPGRVHGRQLLRLGKMIQEMIDSNDGWGFLHLELRGGTLHKVSKEECELFSLEHLRPTA